MDCQKLREDIDGLIEQKEQCKTFVDNLLEDGKGKAAVTEALERASRREDELLSSYLEDFCEKFYLKMEESESFEVPSEIERVDILSDGSIVVSGIDERVYMLSRDEATGQYAAELFLEYNSSKTEKLVATSGNSIIVRNTVGGAVTCIDKDGKREEIGRNRFIVKQSAQLSNGDILLCDSYGNMNLFTKQSNGKLEQGQAFGRKGKDKRKIRIAAMPAGGAAIYEDGRIYLCTQDAKGQYELGEPIGQVKGEISAIEVAPNGDIFTVSGSTLRVLRRRKDGGYDDSKQVANYRSMASKLIDKKDEISFSEITSMHAMGNGDILVSCYLGWVDRQDRSKYSGAASIMICELQDDGKYKLNKTLASVDVNNSRISGILPDGRILMTGRKTGKILGDSSESGKIIGGHSLAGLKKNLKDIARMQKQK